MASLSLQPVSMRKMSLDSDMIFNQWEYPVATVLHSVGRESESESELGNGSDETTVHVHAV